MQRLANMDIVIALIAFAVIIILAVVEGRKKRSRRGADCSHDSRSSWHNDSSYDGGCDSGGDGGCD